MCLTSKRRACCLHSLPFGPPLLFVFQVVFFFQLWEERKVNWPDTCIASTLKAFPSCPVSYNTDKMSRRPKSTKSNLRAFDHSLFKNHETIVCCLQQFVDYMCWLLTVYWVKMTGAKMWPFLHEISRKWRWRMRSMTHFFPWRIFFLWHEYAMGKKQKTKKHLRHDSLVISMYFLLSMAFMCFLCTNDKLSNRVCK